MMAEKDAKPKERRLPKNSDIKRQCREMYFNFRPFDEIVHETGVKKLTLRSWICGKERDDPESWRILRSRELGHFVEDVTIRNTNTAHRIVRMGFQMVHESLAFRYNMKDKENKPIPLELREARYVAQIISSIQKLMCFGNRGPDVDEDEDNPLPPPVSPDYLRTRPATLEELRAAVLKDPFVGQLIEGETNGDEREEQPGSATGISDAELAEPGIPAAAGELGLHGSTRPDSDGEGPRAFSQASDHENGDAGEDD